MTAEVMEFDAIIVGAGPAGLAAACKLGQLAKREQRPLSICVLEKGSEVGAHLVSGAILDPKALDELFPGWRDEQGFRATDIVREEVYFMNSEKKHFKIPSIFLPNFMHNKGNYIISIGDLCRWLGKKAEELGVEIFPGFSAKKLLIEDNVVKGVITGDMGVDARGEKGSNYFPGMELRAKYTLFAEGTRGHLGKQLIANFALGKNSDPQHYGLGIKEIWEIPKAMHQEGLVIHSAGWPLVETGASGGGFLYHIDNQQVVLGVIVDLCYKNPHIDPFAEFQRFKSTTLIRPILEQGNRVSYGARALTKGGLQSLPKMSFPGGLLIGCDAGTLTAAKLKGIHTAMRSGMLASEELFEAIGGKSKVDELGQFNQRIKRDWLYKELYQQRNFVPYMQKFNIWAASALSWFDIHLLNGKIPWTLRNKKTDFEQLLPAKDCKAPIYPKPDNQVTFDKLSSVFLSNTNHKENQPCHLQLKDEQIPISVNLPIWDEPAPRYCPAGVYEILEKEGNSCFHINAQNCVHCKTCDIKDPSQNINWTAPEAGGGPNYQNM